MPEPDRQERRDATTHDDPSFLRREDAGQRSQQRRLAGTVASDDAEDRTLRHGEGDVAQRRDLARFGVRSGGEGTQTPQAPPVRWPGCCTRRTHGPPRSRVHVRCSCQTWRAKDTLVAEERPRSDHHQHHGPDQAPEDLAPRRHRTGDDGLIGREQREQRVPDQQLLDARWRVVTG